LSARALLRSGTAEEHQRVDALFIRFDLGDIFDYTRFIRGQAAAFLPLEARLDAAGASTVVPDWDDRRRADLLRLDLAELGAPVPAATSVDLSPMSEAERLGAIYVLEGSRLGGKYLLRAVPPAFPRRFLSAQQAPGAWRKLLELIDASLYGDADRSAALAAAREAFALFERAGAVELETSRA
jgi:heme oxygenase (biliverdin-IX-beta and delta-forming)